MAIDKQLLGLSAEYAVASELCRRGVYAQLTLGPRKRTDILLETETSMLRVQIKAKQGSTWPNCKGIYGNDIILVLVDYKGTLLIDRPSFFILNPQDWVNLIRQELAIQIQSGDVQIDRNNVPIWIKQLDRNGNPYKGFGIKRSQVCQYQDQWDKIPLLPR